ncbi:MAG TPA: MMPL family transporter [Myxococcales bacterium LLY-WYZ-16_1]|nr:MMPL family transporter [Myxococcales bacterium LLY-WYZ-16_1]
MRVAELARRAAAAAVSAPYRVLGLASLLAVASLAWTGAHLELEADRNALIRPGREWNDRFEAYRRDFGGTRDFLVVVRGGDLSQRQAFIDALVERLEQDPRVASAWGRVDPDAFRGSQLLLMEPESLSELRRTLARRRESLAALVDHPSLEAILAFVDREVSRALVSSVVGGLFSDDEEESDEAESDPVDLDFLIALSTGIQQTLQRGEASDIDPWSEWLVSADRGYLSLRDGELLLASVAPTTEGNHAVSDGRSVDGLKAHLDALQTRFPEVRAGVTGQRAINVAEMRSTVRDTRWAGILALLGVSVVFMAGFGRARHPLLAVVALLIGIAWAAGALTVVVGHLTVLSVAFTSILVGLGIDFGIHVVARFEEARAMGLDAGPAAEWAVERSAPGNLAAALTTSLAFFGLGFSDFLGLAELGIIAGMGVLLCLVAQTCVLPALLGRFGGRGREPRVEPPRPNATLGHPAAWVSAGVFAALVGFGAGTEVGFDGNLLRLQAEGTEAVDLELELVGARGSAFAVTRAADLQQARSLQRQFTELEEVSAVESVARLFPEDVAARTEAARSLLPLIPDPDRAPPPEELGLSVEGLRRRVDKLRFKLRPEREDRWDEDTRPTQEALTEVRTRLNDIHEALSSGPDPKPLRAYQTRVAEALVDRLHRLRRETEPRPLSFDDLPEPVRRRLIGRDGSLLLRIHPAENVWEDEAKARFVKALRSVDPEVTGIPVQSYEASRLMLRGYIQGGLLSLGLVLLVLAFDLRRLRDVASALVPLVLGAGWTLGLMAIAGLKFNLANLIILPLMIGIGIDIGVHLVHRFREDGQVGLELARGSTGRAVVLSSLTTMVGFGSLAVAQHRGIRSLGILLAVGVAASAAAALLVLPAVLQWMRFERRR